MLRWNSHAVKNYSEGDKFRTDQRDSFSLFLCAKCGSEDHTHRIDVLAISGL